jgi:trehalose-6-phosphate synthase
MQRMRRTIREHNIYRWAASLITELCEVRLDESDDTQDKLRASVVGA